MSIMTTLVLGIIIGGSAMTALQKAAAKVYATSIHNGKRTLDDVKPQTAEYRAYVMAVYHQMYPNEQL